MIIEKIQHILFDVDGVLLKSWEWQRILEKNYGISPTITKEFYKGPFLDCLIGKKDLYTELTPFLNKWNLDLKTEVFVKKWFEADSTINNSVVELLNQFGIAFENMSIATNQERYRTEYIWNDMGFSKYFKSIYSSVNIGYTKPDFMFFKYIHNDLDLQPENILFIDDSLLNIESAKKLGWNTIHIEDNDVSCLFELIGKEDKTSYN